MGNNFGVEALLSAVSHFSAVFASTQLANDIATKLTCTEVEALAELLELDGESRAASIWREIHARDDEPGELHYKGEEG